MLDETDKSDPALQLPLPLKKSRKYTHVPEPLKIQIAAFLETVLERTNPGWCQYKRGWSDAKVAKRFKVTPLNIKGSRLRNKFGKLQPVGAGVIAATKKSATYEQLAASLNAQAARVRKLEAWAMECGYNPQKT